MIDRCQNDFEGDSRSSRTFGEETSFQLHWSLQCNVFHCVIPHKLKVELFIWSSFHRPNTSILPDAFICNNEEITDPVQIGNKFNEYYTNVGPNFASKIPTINTSFKAFMSKTRYCESFFIDPVTEEEVEKELLGLNSTKSVGYDSFNLKVI